MNIKNKKKTTEEQKREWLKAIRGNDIETIKRIIKEGININIQNEFGETALHYACFYNRIEMTNLLIENGADVNIKNDIEWTPLHVACYRENIETAKLMIGSGADITARDDDGKTPWDEFKISNLKRYEELMQWITEYYPEKMLEIMAHENIQGKGTGL